MALIVTLTRKFKVGSTLLDDIESDPPLAPIDVLRAYAPTFPFLAQCTVDEGTVQGDSLVYEAFKAPVATKGASSAMTRDDAAKALRAWAESPTFAVSAAVNDEELADRHRRFADALREIVRSPSEPVDPWIIALA
jgi:PRTRC genetic system protein C